jgi:hypothetical protein
VPVATWIQHTQFDVAVPGGKRIRSATVDPDEHLPDVDRANNTFTAGASAAQPTP